MEPYKSEVDAAGKLDVPLKVHIYNAKRELICDVDKVVYVKKR